MGDGVILGETGFVAGLKKSFCFHICRMLAAMRSQSWGNGALPRFREYFEK
jgi:hypothetical protein